MRSSPVSATWPGKSWRSSRASRRPRSRRFRNSAMEIVSRSIGRAWVFFMVVPSCLVWSVLAGAFRAPLYLRRDDGTREGRMWDFDGTLVGLLGGLQRAVDRRRRADSAAERRRAVRADVDVAVG